MSEWNMWPSFKGFAISIVVIIVIMYVYSGAIFCVCPGIYIGTSRASLNARLLGNHAIKLVVQVSDGDHEPLLAQSARVLHAAFPPDGPLVHMPRLLDIIHEYASEGQHVLICSKTCRGLGPTVAAAYLVRFLGYSEAAAVAHVNAIKPDAMLSGRTASALKTLTAVAPSCESAQT